MKKDMMKLLNAQEIDLEIDRLTKSKKEYPERIEILKKEKESLEQILDHKVLGIRQHYLNMNDKTWGIQYDAGFMYDSSLGFTDKIGFKGSKTGPFHPLNNDFLEIPLAICPWHLFRTAYQRCNFGISYLLQQFQ